MNRLGVIIAVDHEAAAVLDDASFSWKQTGRDFFLSADGRVELALSGVGKVFAAYAATRLSESCDTLCTMGTSGGMTDERIGDLFLCTEFVEHDMGGTFAGIGNGITPFSAMKDFVITHVSDRTVAFVLDACARAGRPVRRARAMSGDHFLSDASAAAEKRRDFGATLVDMESAAVAKICAFRTEREFFALRWVSDNANHDSGTSWAENVRASSGDFAAVLKRLHEAMLTGDGL